MFDKTAVLLRHAGQETRHVLEGYERYVEAVAEAYETRSLHRGINVQNARQKCWLVRYDSNGAACKPCEPYDYVGRVKRLDFKKVAVVNNRVNHIAYVVRLVGSFRDDAIKFFICAI